MTPEEACALKATYLSESCATNAAFLINLRNRTKYDRDDVQVPYRCSTCGDYHLTGGRQCRPLTA